MATTTPTDEQVLADPSAYTVDQVLDVFRRSTPGQVDAAKELEADGKARASIADYLPPPPEPDPIEERYSRDRIIDREEGPRIAGVKHPVIVGALDGNDNETFTRTELSALVDAFTNRVAHPAEEA